MRLLIVSDIGVCKDWVWLYSLIPGKLDIRFHYYCAVYDVSKYLGTWQPDNMLAGFEGPKFGPSELDSMLSG